MKNQKKLLQAIKRNFQQKVVTAPTYELDEHIPIYGSNLQILGYFNIRCYDDLRKTLKNKENDNF